MAEIPFRIGSHVKWISGISEETTCRDILIAVLRSESLLDCDEQEIHHHYALVETWRQVSKVLSPNSLILKIWLAWDEEQANVMFSIKRIKNEKKSPAALTGAFTGALETSGEARPRKMVKRRNSAKLPSTVDTLHPRAIHRSKQLMCKEIHDQMKKIINQGEIIRKHLENIKDSEPVDSQQQAVTGEQDQHQQNPFQNSVPLPPSPRSKDILQNKSDSNSDSAFNDSFLEQSPSPANPALSENVPRWPRGEKRGDTSVNNICQNGIYGPDTRETFLESDKIAPPPPSPSRPHDIVCRPEEKGTVVNLLENIHRLNCLLQSKEEQALSLDSTCQLLQAPVASQWKVDREGVMQCFDQEVVRYRDLNAMLLQEIQENSGQLAELVKNTDLRRKMVTQLEFDVNIIERESKRLQSDLSTIQSIGTDLPAQVERLSTCEDQDCPPRRDDNIEPDHDHSPDSVNDTAGTKHNLQLSTVSTSPFNNTKKVLEYGSDSSSDTGVCSLSSTEGDYSLSTLV